MSGLLDRWQRRRAAVAEETAREAQEISEEREPALPQEGEQVEAAGTIPLAEEATTDPVSSEENEAVQALPDPEQIEHGGSFAAFMKPGVAADKRQEALRSLWKQPHYNVRDGLCEYDLDYAAQPKLSAKVAAELAEKVFRHVVKEAEETTESAVAQRDKKSPDEAMPESESGHKVASEGDEPDETQSPA